MSSNDIRIDENIKNYTKVPLLLTLLFAAMDVVMYFLDIRAGILGTIFVVLYLFVLFFLYRTNQPRVYDELVDFATQYSTVQKEILEDFETPILIADGRGKLLWVNRMFSELTGVDREYRKSITSIFPEITLERLKKEEEMEIPVQYENRKLRAHIRSIDVEAADQETTNEVLTIIYLFDETELIESRKANEELQMVPALVYIDNYEEIADTVEEVKQSLLLALADRKVSRYFSTVDGIVKKIDRDKYFVVFKKKYLKKLQDDKFSLLEDIKTIKVGNEGSMTLSIGLGCAGDSYSRNYEYARSSVELAIGRGGAQAILKTPDDTVFYGGDSEPVAKSNRVKARVKALALREILVNQDSCLIMGHAIADIDAFGAAIGIYCAARHLGKHTQIVLDEVTTSLRPIRDCFTMENGYPDDLVITPEEALEKITPDTVLIVVDTNRPSYAGCPELLEKTHNIVVFDHHRLGNETISNAMLSYIEPYASSTCEMVAEVLQYFDDNVRLNSVEADALYAGMLIDTNNFMTKTGVRTFEAAAYLRRCGAETTRVRKLLRNDMNAYKARAEAIRHAEVYRNSFAISVCPADNIESPTVASAQAANELLNIIGIRASFVLTDYHGKIYISSRSIDEINVQRIMERLGGGGHLSTAGAQLANCSTDEAVRIIKNTIDEMIKEGDIKE